MSGLRVMSFNLRRDVDQDGANAWRHRQAAVADVIHRHAPHLLGTQEGLPHQLAVLDAYLPDYRRVGSARCGQGADEANALYYDPSRLDLMAAGDFWLSDEPTLPGSQTWGSDCPRLVTWARFTDLETGREVTCANTHFDHKSGHARLLSAHLLRKYLPEAILMGDFNAIPGDAVHRFLTEAWVDAHAACVTQEDDGHTYHGFTGDATMRIDWVLVPKGMAPSKHRVVRDRPGGVLPSDHWPVFAEIDY